MLNVRSETNIFNCIIFSDECVLHLSGKVNTQNSRICATETPHSAPFNTRNVTICCGFGLNPIIGLYYFDNMIVNGNNYLHLLSSFSLPTLHNYPYNTIFQKDGEPEHFRQYLRQYINEYLDGSWIGRGSSLSWPTRVPWFDAMWLIFVGYVKFRSIELLFLIEHSSIGESQQHTKF